MSIIEQITQCKKDIEDLQDKLDGMRKEDDVLPLAEAAASSGCADHTIGTKMKQRKTLAGHFGKIYSMDWAPDSEHLVSAAQDGKLIIWNGLHEAMLHAIQLRSSWVMACTYSPDGKLVASGGLDNACSVYKIDFDSASNTQGPSQELAGHEGYLSCCKFVSNTEMLTSSGDGTCVLWDIASQTAKTTFEGHESDVMCVSMSGNNDWFVSASCDSTCKLWDYRAGPSCIKTFVGHESDINSIAFFPGEHMFGTASDDSTCRLFDIRSYASLNRFADDHVLCGITSCAFSASGRALFAGYDDYNCLVWDTLTGACVQVLSGHENRVSCLGVNPQGNALCTGSWSTQLKIWA